jgi:acyl dehydratase
MATVVYAEAPRLGSMYRTAARSALRGARPTGDSLPDAELVLRDTGVDRDHLASYDRVCGFRLADTLPATYPHILAFPLSIALMTRADFPLPLVGLVHVASTIELRRPLGAGERFEIRVRAEHLRPHDRGRQVDLVAEVYAEDEPVWAGRSTYLHRQAPRGGAGSGTRTAAATAADAAPAPTALWRVDPTVGHRYAEVSGDRNPIHTSRLGARLFGFPRPIAHGMWSLARCVAALEGRLPPAYAVQVAFKLPIPLPSTVAYRATPTGTGGWTLSLSSARSGKPHLAGTITPFGPAST